jgi:prohibitin 2
MQLPQSIGYGISFLLILIGITGNIPIFVLGGWYLAYRTYKQSPRSWTHTWRERIIESSDIWSSFAWFTDRVNNFFDTASTRWDVFTSSFFSMDTLKLVSKLFVAVIVVMVIFSGFKIVDPGHKGVKIRLGNVYDMPLDEGLHWKVPLIDTIYQMNVQVQKVEATSNSATKDLQNVSTTVALNYNIKPELVANLYQTIGKENDIVYRIIEPAGYETVKAITARYTAEELISKRAEVSTDITTMMKEKLENRGIQVVAVNIVNFQFSAAFDTAIEAKVQAEQEALTAKNKLERIKFEAQQKIEQSKAEAETIRIQAEAIREQGGAEYVQLKRVEKRDGKLPTTNLGDWGNGLIFNLNK